MIVKRQYASSGRVIPLRKELVQEMGKTMPKFRKNPAHKWRARPVILKSNQAKLIENEAADLKNQNVDINEFVTLPGPKIVS